MKTGFLISKIAHGFRVKPVYSDKDNGYVGEVETASGFKILYGKTLKNLECNPKKFARFMCKTLNTYEDLGYAYIVLSPNKKAMCDIIFAQEPGLLPEGSVILKVNSTDLYAVLVWLLSTYQNDMAKVLGSVGIQCLMSWGMYDVFKKLVRDGMCTHICGDFDTEDVSTRDELEDETGDTVFEDTYETGDLEFEDDNRENGDVGAHETDTVTESVPDSSTDTYTDTKGVSDEEPDPCDNLSLLIAFLGL